MIYDQYGRGGHHHGMGGHLQHFPHHSGGPRGRGGKGGHHYDRIPGIHYEQPHHHHSHQMSINVSRSHASVYDPSAQVSQGSFDHYGHPLSPVSPPMLRGEFFNYASVMLSSSVTLIRFTYTNHMNNRRYISPVVAATATNATTHQCVWPCKSGRVPRT